jgi:hypothetical protein
MDILKKNRTYTIDLKDILIVDIRLFKCLTFFYKSYSKSNFSIADFDVTYIVVKSKSCRLHSKKLWSNISIYGIVIVT